MARNVFTYRFDLGVNPYVADRGVESSLGARFVLPPDMTVDDGTNIATAASGTPITGTTLDTPSICGDTNSFSPRKVTFIRSDGSSLSLVIPVRENILTIAQQIATTIAGAGSGLAVVCAKLEGESIRNLIDELRTSTTAPVAGTPPFPATGSKNTRFSSTMLDYAVDATFGAVSPQRFRMDTDLNTAGALAPPTILGAAATGCLGTLGDVATCQGRNRTRTPRFYTVTALVTNYKGGTADLSSNIQVPQASGVAADILDCGTQLANLDSTLCLGYKGENYNRLHRLFVAA